MTVKDLATSAGKPINDIFDAISFVDQHKVYYHDTVMENPQIVYETVRKIGAKVRVVNPPSKRKQEEEKEDEDEEVDAVKR